MILFSNGYTCKAFATQKSIFSNECNVLWDCYVCKFIALGKSIISNGKSSLKVVCGEGELEILEIQMAGKRRMKISEFLLGFRNPEEYIFK